MRRLLGVITVLVIIGLTKVSLQTACWVFCFVCRRPARTPPEQPEKKHPQDDVERHVRVVGEWVCYAAGFLCGVQFKVENDAHLGAWIDYSDWTIRITKGIYNDCRSEDELAGMLAHEIGHLAMLIGKQSGRTEPAIDQEYKADRLAASYLSNAGYDPNALGKVLWRHTLYGLQAGDPDFLNRQSITHPPFIKRMVAANLAVRLLPQKTLDSRQWDGAVQ